MSDKRTVPVGTSLGRFTSYPAYKDSGVESLGEIPAHWEVYPLRRKLFREAGSIKIGPFGSQLKLEFMTQEGFKVYGQEHVIARDFSRGSKYVNQAKFSELAACEIRPNDLVITMMGSSGRCAVVPEEIERGIMDSHLLRIRLPDAELDPRFLCLLIDESGYVRDQIGASGKGAIMHGLNSSIIKSILLAVPPTSEQLRILAFLARETEKIDALVAKKERVIELLQEKRTALITKAVTKGLDPNVPMKNSGVEWLGDIPARWDVKRLKYLVPDLTVGIVVTPAKYYVDDGIPCLRSLNISSGEIDMDDLVFISKEANEYHRKSKIFEGDVVVVRTGQAGTAAIVPEKLSGANCIDLLIVRRSAQIRSRMVYYYLNSRAAISQAEVRSVGAIQGHYNTSTLAELLVPVVPVDEQDYIVRHLDDQTAAIDALTETIGEGIDRLTEFRTALISAAVTGKIDVREGAA